MKVYHGTSKSNWDKIMSNKTFKSLSYFTPVLSIAKTYGKLKNEDKIIIEVEIPDKLLMKSNNSDRFYILTTDYKFNNYKMVESYKERLNKLLESRNDLSLTKQKMVEDLYKLWNNSFKDFKINEQPDWERISPSSLDNSFYLGFFCYYSESALDKNINQRGLYELRKIGEKGLETFKQGLKSIKGKFDTKLKPKLEVEAHGFSNSISISFLITVIGSKIKVIFKDNNTGKQYVAGVYRDKYKAEDASGRDWFTYLNNNYKTNKWEVQIYMKSKYTTIKEFEYSSDARKYLDKIETIYEEVEY